MPRTSIVAGVGELADLATAEPRRVRVERGASVWDLRVRSAMPVTAFLDLPAIANDPRLGGGEDDAPRCNPPHADVVAKAARVAHVAAPTGAPGSSASSSAAPVALWPPLGTNLQVCEGDSVFERLVAEGRAKACDTKHTSSDNIVHMLVRPTLRSALR